MYSRIISQLQTSEDVSLLREEIDMLRKAVFTGQGKFEHELSQSVRKGIKEAILEDLASKEIDKSKYLEGLVQQIDTLEPIKLTVAHELDQNSLGTIYAALSESLGDGFVMDIYYSPALVAGAIVSYKGKYYDGSLQRKINELYDTKQGK